MKKTMFKMYGLTIIFSVAIWAIISFLFIKDPVGEKNALIAIGCYGTMIPITLYSVWLNIIKFKSVPLPYFLEKIRIPWAAIGLGINSAYYHLSFVSEKTQELLAMPAIKNLWIAIEVILTISLIVGIYRKGMNYKDAENPNFDQKSEAVS